MAYKFCHITDLHMADRAYGSHQPWFMDELWKQLEEVQDICLEQGRDLYITGDLFEYPRANLVSHALVGRLIEYFNGFRAKGLKVFMVAGNHDLGPDGMNSFNRQPIAVLQRAGAASIYTESVCMKTSAGWIQLTSLHYDPAAESDPEFYRVTRDPRAKYHITMAHGMLVPPGLDLPYPHVPLDAAPMADADLVLYGHHHDYHGINEYNGTTFVQLGSFCRRSRSQKRDVRIALCDWDSQNGLSVVEHKLESASRWQDIFLDIPDQIEVEHDFEVMSIAREAKQLLLFEEVDFRNLLDEFRSKVDLRILDIATNYLNEAEASINGINANRTAEAVT